MFEPDGAGRLCLRWRVRLVHETRTRGGQDLGKASGSANRLLSRTVTVFAGHRPRRRTPRHRPPRHPRACQPGHRASILIVPNEPVRCLLVTPARRSCRGGQHRLVWHRGERDLDGQAAGAPGARGDRGIVGGGDGADDGQAQAVAAVIVHATSVELLEGLEQSGRRPRAVGRPGVGHGMDGAAAHGRGADLYFPAGDVVTLGETSSCNWQRRPAGRQPSQRGCSRRAFPTGRSPNGCSYPSGPSTITSWRCWPRSACRPEPRRVRRPG
jgi:hypothetical protein